MLSELFIVLFALSLGFMVYGYKSKLIVWSMLSTVLFLVCAFSSFNIEIVSNGETISFTEPAFIYISWFFAIVSLVITLIGIVSYVRGRRDVM